MDLFDVHTSRKDLLEWRFEQMTAASHRGIIIPDAVHAQLCGGPGEMTFQGLRSEDEYTIWKSGYAMEKPATFISESLSSAFELNIMLSNSAEHTLFDYIHQSIAAQQYNLFFLPYIKNEITLYKGQQYDTLDFHFDLPYFEKLLPHYPNIIGPMLDKAYRGQGTSFLPAAYFLNEDQRFFGKHILRLITKHLDDKYYLDMAVRMFLIDILQNRLPEPQRKIPSFEEEDSIIAAHAKLMDDLTEFTSIRELAKIARMNSTTFKTLYKQKYSLSPKKYWNDFRMDRAFELLIHSKKTVTEISIELGFMDLSSFSRAFHQKYQITPAELKRRAQ